MAMVMVMIMAMGMVKAMARNAECPPYNDAERNYGFHHCFFIFTQWVNSWNPRTPGLTRLKMADPSLQDLIAITVLQSGAAEAERSLCMELCVSPSCRIAPEH